MKKWRLLGVALIAAAATSQESGRWRFIAMAGDESVVSIDSQTIQTEEGIATVWVQYFNKPGMGEYIKSRQVVKNLQREEYHCRIMQVGILSYAKFAADGTNLAQWTALTPSFSPIIPDTTSEAVWKAVCAK